MEQETKSTNQLFNLLLICICIPIVYSLGRKYWLYPEIINSKSFFDINNLWFLIQESLYVICLIQLARRKYSLLLFYFGLYTMKCLRFLFIFTEYLHSETTEYWLFNALNFLCLGLLIVLILRQKETYFNFQFKPSIQKYKRTSNFSVAFCATYLVLQGIEISYLSLAYFIQGKAFIVDIVFFLIILILFIIAITKKPKTINLALAFAVAGAFGSFLMNGVTLLYPFKYGINSYYGIEALIYAIVFAGYGILLIYIAQNFAREDKSEGTYIDEKIDLLD